MMHDTTCRSAMIAVCLLLVCAALGSAGYPLKPGHFVSSITYCDDLTTLPGQWQLVDL